MKKLNGWKRLVLSGICLLLFSDIVVANNNKVEVICHYMTWFKYRKKADNKLEVSHWKWSGKKANHDPRKSNNGKIRDIYSVLYPRIGIYDSGDPLVIDYHILSAKAAGISTLIIDWYNPGSDSDLAFQTLLERCEKLNMKVAICYEEKTCFPDWNKISTRQEAIAKAVKDFSYMKKYFNRKAYWSKDGKPIVLVFGGWGDWDNGKKFFTDQEWSEIAQKSGTESWVVLQNHKENYPNIKAAFSWLGLGDPKYLGWYYSRGDALVEKGNLKFYIGSVCPGFDDRGTWGWNSKPRFEAYLGLENFDRYLKRFDASKCSIIQVVTWNDFSEGTSIEPSVQYGNLFLNRLGEWSAKRNNKQFAKINTLLAYKWFYLAKSLGENEDIIKIREMLAEEKYVEANALIEASAKSRKIKIMPYVSYDKEFAPYSGFDAKKVAVKKDIVTKPALKVKWASDGFLKFDGAESFVLSKRNYGAVNEITRRGTNDKLQIDVLEITKGASYTIQLLMFDSKNKYIGSIDIKKGSAPGTVNIDIPQLKLKPNTVKTALKIWLSGKPDSKIRLMVK